METKNHFYSFFQKQFIVSQRGVIGEQKSPLTSRQSVMHRGFRFRGKRQESVTARRSLHKSPDPNAYLIKNILITFVRWREKSRRSVNPDRARLIPRPCLWYVWPVREYLRVIDTELDSSMHVDWVVTFLWKESPVCQIDPSIPRQHSTRVLQRIRTLSSFPTSRPPRGTSVASAATQAATRREIAIIGH